MTLKFWERRLMTGRSILHVRLHEVPFALYGETFRLLGDITLVVQALPPDSTLLDVTAHSPTSPHPEGLADLIATRLLACFGLLAAIGGAYTPLLAGLATGTCAASRIRILEPGTPDTWHFLRSRPVEASSGVGPKLGRTLARYGSTTTGDLADLPLPRLHRIAGTGIARLLHDRANGRAPRTVAPCGPPASITATRQFPADVLDPSRSAARCSPRHRPRRPPAHPAQDLPRRGTPDHLRRPQQHHPHPWICREFSSMAWGQHGARFARNGPGPFRSSPRNRGDVE